MTIKVCVIGCGALGKHHAQGWARRPDVEVVAVCDPQEARAAAVAKEVGATPYADYRQALAHPGLEAVSVATPTRFHPEISCLALDSGLHVLCEKPIALTMAEADEMVECARKNDRRLAISLQRRGWPSTWRKKRLFEEGAFGGPVHWLHASAGEVRPKAEMNRKSYNGGPLVDVTCHYVDEMRFITSCEPELVFAAGDVFARGKARVADYEDDLAIDAAQATVRFEGGHMVSLYFNWGMPTGFKGWRMKDVLLGPELCVTGQDGAVVAQFADRRVIYDHDGEQLKGPYPRIDDLVDAIRQNRPPLVTGEDGRAALAVSLAALESIETGQSVKIART